MNNLTWLVEDSVFAEDIDPILNQIKEQGFNLITCEYIPFETGFEITNKKELPKDNSPIIFYGSLNLAKYIQKKHKFCPGVYCNFDNFLCHKYFSYFGKYLLNKEYVMLSLQELIRQKDFIFDKFAIDDNIFVRPDKGNKPFTGCVVNRKELSLEFFNFGTYFEDNSILCAISSPKIIDGEWRFAVGNKKIFTGGQYRLNGEYLLDNTYPIEAFNFASKIASEEFEPDNMYVIDICKSNNEYHLLEINSFSCSGFYSCDPEKLVKEASIIAIMDWKETYGE